MITYTIALQGCLHGSLSLINEEIERYNKSHENKCDLLIQSGDFEAMRNENDLETIASPKKYLNMGDFHKFYSGKEQMACPVVFVAGNHTSSNITFRELYYGGFVAPNIYYLGASGVVRFGSLVIGGISGIHQHYDFKKGYYEKFPLDKNGKRSIFHVRELEIQKLKAYGGKVDFM